MDSKWSVSSRSYVKSDMTAGSSYIVNKSMTNEHLWEEASYKLGPLTELKIEFQKRSRNFPTICGFLQSGSLP